VSPNDVLPDEENVLSQTTKTQMQYFASADPRCRALQLPEGILLRYNLSQSLYFYLRSGVKEGRLTTRVFASDSPYDRQKANIGEVRTPMFEPRSDQTHLDKLEKLVRAWVDFVKDNADADQDFTSFAMEQEKAD
jgi:hypothetical protein